MRPKYQKELALAAGYKGHTSVSLLLRGLRGAKPAYALRLGQLTGSDPFLWLKGGDIAKRLAAFQRWKKLCLKQASPGRE